LRLINKIFLSTFWALWIIGADAQFAHCPKFKNHEWKTEEDFNLAEDSVKMLCRWLNETPIGWDYEKRTSANLYITSWVTQHPVKKWNWSTSCFGPLEDHLELMYAFIQASLFYSLTHDQFDEQQREVFVMYSMAKKIEQSEYYHKMEDWEPLVRAVRKKEELEYLEKCRGISYSH